MTCNDIIRWATQAKLPYYYRTGEINNLPEVERFAALVAAAEREACAEHYLDVCRKAIVEEREACAAICDHHDKWGAIPRQAAAAIRARSNT